MIREAQAVREGSGFAKPAKMSASRVWKSLSAGLSLNVHSAVEDGESQRSSTRN